PYGVVEKAEVLAHCQSGGLLVRAKGIKCYLPQTQIVLGFNRDHLSELIGQKIRVMRLSDKAGYEDTRPIVSQQAAAAVIRPEWLKQRSKGEVIPGAVAKHVLDAAGALTGVIVRFDDINTGFVNKPDIFVGASNIPALMPVGKLVQFSVKFADTGNSR